MMTPLSFFSLTSPGVLLKDDPSSPSKALVRGNNNGLTLNGSPGPVVVSGPDGTHVVLSPDSLGAAFSVAPGGQQPPPHTQPPPTDVIVGEIFIFCSLT